MSVVNLTAFLDGKAGNGAPLVEGERNIILSGLSSGDVVDAAACLREVAWEFKVFDTGNNQFELNDLDDDFGPFRVDIEKGDLDPGVLSLVSNTGFAQMLRRDAHPPVWKVAGLTELIETIGVTFLPWHEEARDAPIPPSQRNPRTLVREFADASSVPASLNPWLLLKTDDFRAADPASKIWMNEAARKLMLTLPDEYADDTGAMRFKGPPRLDLTRPNREAECYDDASNDGFVILQEAVGWVFGLERETEMRHILLATEIARSGGTMEDAASFLCAHLADALEAAKTAYQLQLAGISSDTLKTLAELRKSVTEDTSKIADATRQVVGSVAAAIAVGLGMLAARVSTDADPMIVVLVMTLAIIFVAINIISGFVFTRLQRDVREQWKPRLYRFLEANEYDDLVAKPARKAENGLFWASVMGAAAIVAIVAVMFILEPRPSDRIETTQKEDGLVEATAAIGPIES